MTPSWDEYHRFKGRGRACGACGGPRQAARHRVEALEHAPLPMPADLPPAEPWPSPQALHVRGLNAEVEVARAEERAASIDWPAEVRRMRRGDLHYEGHDWRGCPRPHPDPDLPLERSEAAGAMLQQCGSCGMWTGWPLSA